MIFHGVYFQGNYTSIDVNVSENDSSKDKDSIQCIRYSNNNSSSSLRNALVIGYSRKVTLFDVINQKVLKTLQFSKYDNKVAYDPSQGQSSGLSLTALAVNQRLNRDHVAVGGKYGHLRIISLTSEVSGAPSIDRKIQDITELSFSRFKQSLLAGSSESGTVALWDANAVKRTSSFLEHRAPATGLAFSPMNEMLLSSSGLDKRCFCYDVLSGKTAATIKATEPLTCLDFRQDGSTISLGTSKGKIFVYDLRSTKTPFQVLDPHPGSSVKCLVYQSVSEGKSMHKNRSTSLLKQTSKKNMLAEVYKENMPIPVLSDSMSTTVGSPKFQNVDISQNKTPASTRFSPAIRDDSQDQIFSPLGAANGSNDSNFKAIDNNSRNISNLSNFSRLSSESVFSPLRENSSNLSNNDLVINQDGSFLPKTPLAQNNSKSFQSPLPIIEEMLYEGNSSVVSKTETEPLTIKHKELPDPQSLDVSYKASLSRKGVNPELSLSIKEQDIGLVSASDAMLADTEEIPCKISRRLHDSEYTNKKEVLDVVSGLKESNEHDNIHQSIDDIAKHRPLNSMINDAQPIDPTFLQADSTSQRELQQITTSLPQVPDGPNGMPSQTLAQLPDEDHFEVETDSEQNNTEKTGMSDIRAMMTAFPEALNPTPFKTSFRSNYVKEPPQNDAEIKSGEGIDRSQKYQQEYLKSVVTECMHDFTTEVRKQLWHIEWDMTKNFQRLREENDRQQEGFNRIYENMMSENQRLREENENLKKSRQFYQL